MLEIQTVTDVLRLVSVPVFLYAAYRDVKTRRVPQSLWVILLGIGIPLFVVDIAFTRADAIRYVLSPVIVIPIAYLLWLLAGFGGADAKGLMVLSILFPTYPTYFLPGIAFPITEAVHGLFAFTVFTNGLLLMLLYPLTLLTLNIANRQIHPVMVLGRPVTATSVLSRHGRIIQGPDEVTLSGPDIDAVKAFSRWCHQNEIRMDEADSGDVNQFMEETDEQLYGTTEDELVTGVLALQTRDEVWVMPGAPFFVPLTFGLVGAVLYGDMMFGVIQMLLLV